MLIKRPARSAHFYHKDGRPFFEVPKLDGSGMRPANVRDANKAGAYRSVTNTLGVIAKPGLVYWQVEQGILAALTLPEIEGEDLSSRAHRAADDAERQATVAAEEGVRLHGHASQYAKMGGLPVYAPDVGKLEPFCGWFDAYVERVVASEEVVLNHELYYAGTLDLAVILKDGSAALLDIKTTEVKKNAKGEPKPDFYDEWALQLAAYSRCEIGFFGKYHPWRLFSGVLNRQAPGFYLKEWTDPLRPLESSTSTFQAFAATCQLWSYLKGCTPGAPK